MILIIVLALVEASVLPRSQLKDEPRMPVTMPCTIYRALASLNGVPMKGDHHSGTNVYIYIYIYVCVYLRLGEGRGPLAAFGVWGLGLKALKLEAL